MFPAKRGNVLYQIFVKLSIAFQMFSRSRQINGVPYAYRVDDYIQCAGSLELVGESALSQFAVFTKENGSGQCVHRFAFIQTTVNLSAQRFI
jgi:hypothetical protein